MVAPFSSILLYPILTLTPPVAIEHDASLSRNDVFLGDQSSFNPTIWNATKAWFPDPLVTYCHLGRALGQRILAANASNPGFNLTEAQKGLAITASAFILLLFGNGTEGNADRTQIKVLFGKYFCFLY